MQKNKMLMASVLLASCACISAYANNNIDSVKTKPDWQLKKPDWILTKPEKPDWKLIHTQKAYVPPTPPKPKKVRKEPDQNAVMCLAKNIYHEARGESYAGQIAVAHVVINRTKNKAFPKTVCAVVWDDYQFSWTLDKKLWKIEDRKAYARAQTIAYKALAGMYKDNTNGATHYYEPTIVSPQWAAHGKDKRKIGNHLFLKMRSGGA